MGTTKRSPYNQKTLELAQTAKALGHPARITIMQYLYAHQYGSNEIFQQITQLSKSTVTQHLKELEHAHLLFTDYVDFSGLCFINPDSDTYMEKLLKEIIG